MKINRLFLGFAALLAVSSCGNTGPTKISAQEWKEKAAATEEVQYAKIDTEYSYTFPNMQTGVLETKTGSISWTYSQGQGWSTESNDAIQELEYEYIGLTAKAFSEEMPEDPESLENYSFYADLSIDSYSKIERLASETYPPEQFPDLDWGQTTIVGETEARTEFAAEGGAITYTRYAIYSSYTNLSEDAKALFDQMHLDYNSRTKGMELSISFAYSK